MANTQPQITDPEITIVSITANSISISWNKATDIETPQSDLMYIVTWHVAPYKWDNQLKTGECKFDISSYNITGLTPNTTYEIIVYVKDSFGSEVAYAKTTMTTSPDNVPNTVPIIKNKKVGYSIIDPGNQVVVYWEKASDNETAQKKLRYEVWCVLKTSLNPSNPHLIFNPCSGKLTDIDVYKFTLIPWAIYSVFVYVYDEQGNKSAYETLTFELPLPTKVSDTKNNSKEIRDYLATVQYKPTDLINNDLYNDKTIYPDAFESLPDRDAAFILTKIEHPFSNKEIYVRGKGYEKIYPGALLLVDTGLTSGDPTPLANVVRNKITIYGDFLAGGNPEEKNVTPDNSEVKKATDRIMETLLRDDRYKAPGTQQPTTKIYTSEKSMMLDFAVDSSFAGVNLKVKAKTDSKESTFIQATTLNQEYFTVKLKDDWRTDPSSLFDKSVTVDQLKKAMNGKALAIVTSVTYGRTFSYLKEYSSKKYTFDSSQRVTGYGQDVSASQNGSEEVTSTLEDIFNLGGTALTISALNSKKTQAELEAAMATNMEFGRSNQGVVTKYTLQLVSGDSPGITLTPSYNGKVYEIGYFRCPRRLSMDVDVKDVRIGGAGGGDVQVHLDVDCFKIIPYSSSKPGEGFPQPSKSIRESTFKQERENIWYFNTNSTQMIEFGHLSKGEYINKDPLIRIKRRASKLGSMKECDRYRLDNGEIQSGKIKLILKGDVATSVKIYKINDKTIHE